MSDKEGDDGKFVVVATTYPTNYGCHRGMSWSRADLIHRSKVKVSKESYNTHDEAACAALDARNGNCLFEGYDELVGGHKPPFATADMENYANDEEVIIQVTTRRGIDEKMQSDGELLKQSWEERHLSTFVEEELFRIRIDDAGGVHYSSPPRPYDIPAELEIVERRDENAVIPENAASVKSIMYHGKHPSFRQLLRKPDKNHFLFQLLSACTSLEELYVRSDGLADDVTLEFFYMLQTQAPHLTLSLKVLSIAMLYLVPDAIQGLQAFQNLERLDLTECFSTLHWNESYEEHAMLGLNLPYDKPMVECIKSLPRLRRLDIGNGDADMQRAMHKYSLSKGCLGVLFYLMKPHGKRITMDDSNEPEEFATPTRAEAARAQALVAVWHREDMLSFVRDLAEKTLKTCCCNKSATKRCSKCKRKWYCGVECQKSDFKSHKYVCEEVFESSK